MADTPATSHVASDHGNRVVIGAIKYAFVETGHNSCASEPLRVASTQRCRRGHCSIVDGLPDELGDIEGKVGCCLCGSGRRADLTDTDTDGVVEAPIRLDVTGVKDGTDDLPASGRIRAPVATAFDMSVDPSSASMTARKSGRNGAVGTLPQRSVRATKATK
jgi:hypothetical protein